MAQAEISILYQFLLNSSAQGYVTTASLTLLAYDTLLTLPQEIEQVWSRKFRAIALLYVVGRYLTIGILLLEYMVLLFPRTSIRPDPFKLMNVCSNYVHLSDVKSLLSLASLQLLVMGRTFAISRQNRGVLVLLWGLSLGSVIAQILVAAHNACVIDSVIEQFLNRLSIAEESFSLAFDTVVIAVMLKYTLWVVRSQKKSFTRVLLQQGLMCYIVIFSCGLANLIAKLILSSTLPNIVSPIQTSLSVIVLCRFLMDIRYRSVHPNGTTQPNIRTRSFHAVLRRTGDMIIEEFGDGEPRKQPKPYDDLDIDTLYTSMVACAALSTVN
ncbi:hypothetical protein JB92DRAFT_389516 [Gautieria morchelliformis]|nr:hypothetical protein JB92DRAFT_389516 [Gautieria morchelliformis]